MDKLDDPDFGDEVDDLLDNPQVEAINVTLFPPKDGNNSEGDDGDSGDEEMASTTFSRGMLTAPGELTAMLAVEEEEDEEEEENSLEENILELTPPPLTPPPQELQITNYEFVESEGSVMEETPQTSPAPVSMLSGLFQFGSRKRIPSFSPLIPTYRKSRRKVTTPEPTPGPSGFSGRGPVPMAEAEADPSKKVWKKSAGGKGVKGKGGEGVKGRGRGRGCVEKQGLPAWVVDRAPGEVFFWEEKPQKTEALKKKKMWTKPTNRWFDHDQGQVGSQVPDVHTPPGNSFHSSEAQNVTTPYQAFNLFWNQEWVNKVVGESVHYGHMSDQGHKAHSVTSDTVKCTTAVILMSGYIRYPQRSMYHEQQPDCGTPAVAEAIRRDTLDHVLACLHLAGMEDDIDKTDRWWKLRPLFTLINNTAKDFFPQPKEMSVDEMMIRYFGRHSDKQFIRNKPVRFGYKMWAICASKGYIVHVEPYCGACTQLPVFAMGQGPDVVAGLVTKGGVTSGAQLFFDNLFTSLPLLQWLSQKGIGGTGTLRNNRVFSTPLPEAKKLEKKERGYSVAFWTDDQCYVGWNDNKGVMMASNTCSSAHGGQVKRYSKAKKANVMVDQPQIIQNYNSFMGGVDLVDQQVALYRPTIKKKKWWFPVLTWGMAVQCHQAWRWFNLLQVGLNGFYKRIL